MNILKNLKSEHSKKVLELTLHKQIPELPTIQKDLCFRYYDLLLYSLQFAYSLSNGEISRDCNLLVEFVSAISFQPKIIRSLFHNFPKMYTPESSRYQCMRAQGLMENFTELNSHSEFQLEFLRKSLAADSFESNDVATSALAYLAVLQFASSEYEQAIRLCIAVLTDQTLLKS